MKIFEEEKQGPPGPSAYSEKRRGDLFEARSKPVSVAILKPLQRTKEKEETEKKNTCRSTGCGGEQYGGGGSP